MRVRFWGTRGSIAKPGRTTLRYGGNTACVEARASDGTLVTLDCGTGAQELGKELTASGEYPLRGHLLISHTHWDHIQGFPFFSPLFVSGNEWEICAPGGRGRQLEAALAGQMSYDYYPITLEELDATVRFHDLTEGVFEVGGIRVTAQYLNHPALALGYRLEADGATVVYASDHEPYSLHPLDAGPGSAPVHHGDQRHVRFLEDADLVIHDAQYSLDEFPERAGWGHSPVERAVDYALAARVKQLAIFHHDPERDDEAVDRLAGLSQRYAESAPHELRVFAAAEGQVIDLPERRVGERPPIEPDASAMLARLPGQRTSKVLIVEDDPDMVLLLKAALKPEEVRLISTPDGESALKIAREQHPSLILLDLNIPRLSGMEVCRRLRADADPRLRDVPILFLTGTNLTEQYVIEAFVAGATDYMTKPIKPTLVRSRVHGWLMRTRPG